MAEESVNIRHFSVKCGHCNTYQTLSHFAPAGEWNVYTYLCENEVCDPEVTKTLIEVRRDVDSFARRDPAWHGGEPHSHGATGGGEQEPSE